MDQRLNSAVPTLLQPGEIIVQRMFSECSSIRKPSVNMRTADLVAQCGRFFAFAFEAARQQRHRELL